VLCAEATAFTLCQLQTLCLKRSISCRERHDRIRRRFSPVRKRVPARSAKFADQLSDRPSSMAERFHQSLQTDSVAFVPLFRNLGSAAPNGVSIHLFGSTERPLKRLPPHHTLVNAVVAVCASKGRVRERPLARVEAVALVNEGCSLSLASWRFPTEDRKGTGWLEGGLDQRPAGYPLEVMPSNGCPHVES